MTTVKVPIPPRLNASVHQAPIHSQGQIAPMLAILIAALFGFMGLVLDGGRIQFEKRHMQLAADAAAMGGAHALVAGKTGQDVIDAARDDAKLNKFEHYVAPDPSNPNPPPAPAMPVNVAVNNPPLSGPRAGDANYVEVIITKDYPTTFMRVIGVEKTPVLARAVAGMENYGEGCVLALNPTVPVALDNNGGGLLQANCGVQVNSNDPGALRTTGGGVIDARPAGIAVYGGATGTGFFPSPTTGVPPARDWLWHVPEPTLPGLVTTVYNVTDLSNPIATPAFGLKISGGTWNLYPGLYTGSTGGGQRQDGIEITGGTVNFYPGIYYLDSGMTVTSQAVLRTVGTDGNPGGPGEGIMFYNTTTGDPTKKNSWNEIDFVGGANVLLNPMTSGPYKGILFFEGRNAVKLTPGHKIHGNAGAVLNGFLYFSKGHLSYAGTTTAGGWTGIIADTINIAGNSVLSSNFLGNSDGETPLRTAILVE